MADQSKSITSETLSKLALDAHLAGYKALRDDMMGRLQRQRQAFNYNMVILGAGVGGIITLLNNNHINNNNTNLIIILMLFLPILIGPMGFIFFDDELIIYRDIFYIQERLRPKLHKLVDDLEFSVEKGGLALLTRSSRAAHPLLSVSRWLLFIVPVYLPVCVLFAYIFVSPDLPLLKAVPHFVLSGLDVFSTLFGFLVLLDVFVALLLAWGVVTAIVEQRKWRTGART